MEAKTGVVAPSGDDAPLASLLEPLELEPKPGAALEAKFRQRWWPPSQRAEAEAVAEPKAPDVIALGLLKV